MNVRTSAEFETLYSEYFDRVYGFLRRLCRNHHIAEELTQETFLQAYVSIHRYRGDCEMYTWLISISKHVYGKYLRRQKRESGMLEIDELAETICSSSDDSPENAYLKKADISAVRRFIRKLPEKYREVLILRIYAELPFEQLSKVLDISENSAKVIYFRAKKMVAEGIKSEI